MSNSVRHHRRQPTRLPCPWDSAGKNTGVGCHFLLRCAHYIQVIYFYRYKFVSLNPFHIDPSSSPLAYDVCRSEAACIHCCCLVTKSCPTLFSPMDCSPPSSSAHRILQARILEWVAISFSRGSS